MMHPLSAAQQRVHLPGRHAEEEQGEGVLCSKRFNAFMHRRKNQNSCATLALPVAAAPGDCLSCSQTTLPGAVGLGCVVC